jgi:predicted transcriptional regulator
MIISSVEKEILDTVIRLREASITQIKRMCGLSIFTVKKLCKLLVDKGYLIDIGGQRYLATGKKIKYLSNEADIDNNSIKNIAAQVAEQISKQIAGKRLIAGQESEIKIKTDFTPQIEDETGSLYSNIDKLGVKSEKEKTQIEESAKLLRNIKSHGGK